MAKKEISESWAELEMAIERLPDEPPHAYQAFLHYAWLQGTDRSIDAVIAHFGYVKETVRLWAKLNNWLDRASQIDAQRWLHEYKEREKLLAKDNERFVEKNREIKTKILNASEKMLDVATNLLNSAEVANEVIETGKIETKDGRFVPQNTTIIMKAKISDIPRLVDTSVKVSRLANELPTEIIEHELPLGKDLSQLSDDELAALRDKNNRVLREKNAINHLDTIG